MNPTEEQVATAGRDIVGILLFTDVNTRVALRDTAESIARTVLTQVLTDIENRIEALGHTDTCSIQLHEKNKYRRCTCWQEPVLAVIRGEV